MTEQTTLLENDIARLSENIAEQYAIDAHYFEDQSIKRGLRNADGTGVLIGVSKVGSVQGYYMMDGERVPMPASFTTAASASRISSPRTSRTAPSAMKRSPTCSCSASSRPARSCSASMTSWPRPGGCPPPSPRT